ncbi:tyrosine-type recombinase/integrase [Vibrio fortis]|uniref:tyrosine-type recombinase/integrase n=1 Tax=Vibrio fortis TaxID=212667 RepID=UPI003EBB4943
MNTLSSYITKIKPILESQLAYSSWRSECSRLNIIERDIGHCFIQDLTKSELLLWINEPKRKRRKGSKLNQKEQWSPKTRNAYLSLLRKILKYAVDDFVISKSPLDNIDFYTVSDTHAHPFTQREIHLISNHKATCEIARSLFKFGVLTGLRMSELIALAWNDIDFDKKILYVRRAKPLAKNYKVPKTRAAERQVELSDEAIRVLRDTEKLTRGFKPRFIQVQQRDNFKSQREHVRFVFINSATKRAFIDPKQYAKTFFTPMLKKLRIDHRGPNQIRHTFASQAITMGFPKEWVRRQLGHVNDMMLDKHYSEWITEDAGDNCERFSAVISRSLNGQQETSIDEPVELPVVLERPSIIGWIRSKLRGSHIQHHTQ